LPVPGQGESRALHREAGSAARRPALSVVVPALNAGEGLRRCLPLLADAEIILADGGSTDDTREVAGAFHASVIAAPRGRGAQLQAGAAAASGEWLLFLHADTVLDPGWREAAVTAMRDSSRAAHFAFALDDPSPQARRLERLVAWRCRWLGLPYGDQGLLISRSLYDALGGFAPLPLMEDVDLIARIGLGRLQALPVRAVTSAARWRRDGWWRRSAWNLSILTLWLAGVSPRLLARAYARG
jgi:rSAM/selenodomain-associated transferase 2